MKLSFNSQDCQYYIGEQAVTNNTKSYLCKVKSKYYKLAFSYYDIMESYHPYLLDNNNVIKFLSKNDLDSVDIIEEVE